MGVRLNLITFSHLRWNFVYQRPQHLLSRWAARHRVIFMEEPEFDAAGPPPWERQNPHPNVFVYRPHTPITSSGFNAEQLPVLRGLLLELMAREQITNYVCWFY